MRNKLYLAVTCDKYELPLFVTDSVKELANKYGVSTNLVLSSISHNRSGAISGRKFIRIEIEEDEE